MTTPNQPTPEDMERVRETLRSLEEMLSAALGGMAYLTIGRSHGGYNIPCIKPHILGVLRARDHILSLIETANASDPNLN